MKSTTKVTIQVEDYKGDITSVTGFKSLKRNQHGNIKGYVGKELVMQFGEDNMSAAMWILDTQDSTIALDWCKVNLLF